MGFKARTVGVNVSRDPDVQGGARKPCFKCLIPTAYWFVRKDVPCCLPCAKTLAAKDVPTKDQYFAQLQEARKPKQIVWFARGGGIAKCGPFASQIDAVNAMRLVKTEPKTRIAADLRRGRADLRLEHRPAQRHEFPADVFVWPEISGGE